MATKKQIAANRRNAQKSTGPRTEPGKHRSRWNSLQHGLASIHTVLPHEDPTEYHRIRAGLIDTWQPANAQELMLVDQVANGCWRMERARRFENAMFHTQIAGLKHAHDLPTGPTDMDDEAVALSFFDEENETGFKTFFRYDGRAQSTYYRALENLRRIQNDRLRRNAKLERSVAGSTQPPSFDPEPDPVLTHPPSEVAANESTETTSTQSASFGPEPPQSETPADRDAKPAPLKPQPERTTAQYATGTHEPVVHNTQTPDPGPALPMPQHPCDILGLSW